MMFLQVVGVVAVEIDMSDISSVKCHIIPDSSELSCPGDYATKVFQRYVSSSLSVTATFCLLFVM